MKFYWNTGRKLLTFAFAFWFIETGVFILLYGWHREAINQWEEYCDDAFQIILAAGFVSMTLGILNWFDKQINN